MDEGKVDAVRSWPTHKTIKKLQLFLGFANFFIKNFSFITSLPVLDSQCYANIERFLHQCTIPDPSQSKQAIRGLSRRFNNWHRSGAFTAARETITTPSMCLLLQEAHSERAKLRYWKLWASRHQTSSGGMEVLAGGPQFYNAHRPSQPWISQRTQKVKPQTGKIGTIFHMFWYLHLLSSRKQKCQSWCPVPSPCSRWNS